MLDHSEAIANIETLWAKLLEHDINHEIIQTYTRSNDKGLAENHAYTVIGVTEEVPGVRLVKVRNPWGFE